MIYLGNYWKHRKPSAYTYTKLLTQVTPDCEPRQRESKNILTSFWFGSVTWPPYGWLQELNSNTDVDKHTYTQRHTNTYNTLLSKWRKKDPRWQGQPLLPLSIGVSSCHKQRLMAHPSIYSDEAPLFKEHLWVGAIPFPAFHTAGQRAGTP